MRSSGQEKAGSAGRLGNAGNGRAGGIAREKAGSGTPGRRTRGSATVGRLGRAGSGNAGGIARPRTGIGTPGSVTLGRGRVGSEGSAGSGRDGGIANPRMGIGKAHLDMAGQMVLVIVDSAAASAVISAWNAAATFAIAAAPPSCGAGTNVANVASAVSHAALSAG